MITLAVLLLMLCSGVCIEVDLTSTKPMSPVMFGAFFEVREEGASPFYMSRNVAVL